MGDYLYKNSELIKYDNIIKLIDELLLFRPASIYDNDKRLKVILESL